jgi:hypothetical protein
LVLAEIWQLHRCGKEKGVKFLDFFLRGRERKCLQVQSYHDIPSAESRRLRERDPGN